ncbi:helix-turn-helix domain-containing protein [Blastococcus colisei]|uniref:helix-turn-helix domain-containing protein n=1 Tax=Blastococcus colisei TaxID=1564162 RepID=UPI00114DC04F|nr:helix-turn-helix domain-containing protein [Blastococcus colisei]
MTGPAAWVLTVFLRKQGLTEWLPGVMPNLTAVEREQLMEALMDLEQTAEDYKAWRASDLGSSVVVDSEVAAGLPHEISVRDAAGVLGVSDRRVRQMCESGELEARKPGWSWLVDRSSVELYGRGAA